MKAQISSEFLIVYSALLMIFLITFIIYFGGSLSFFQTQDAVTSFRNAQTIAAAINYVYLAGDGASYNLSLTNIVSDESITISEYAVTSKKTRVSASAAILDGNVNASSIANGNGTVGITNNKGEINIGD